MKTTEEMRNKYWLNVDCGLYPSVKSPLKLLMRFNHEEYSVDEKHMNEARRHAQRAVIFNWLGQEQKAERAFNEANSYLAGAMQVDGNNEKFWNQFL